MSFPECGLCDGMRICSCKSEPIDKRFIAACHAMQGLIAGITELQDNGIITNRPNDVAELAALYADALIAELEKK